MLSLSHYVTLFVGEIAKKKQNQRCFAQCFGMRYVTFDCGFSISPAKKLLMSSDREMAVLLRETGNGMGMNGVGRDLTKQITLSENAGWFQLTIWKLGIETN